MGIQLNDLYPRVVAAHSRQTVHFVLGGDSLADGAL